jgi:uncharacterized protein YggT (Ycf19 family)
VTEPVLAPIRRLLPRFNLIDLAPLGAFVALQVLQLLAHKVL